MEQRKVRRRVHKGRVTGALIILIVLITLIGKGCSKDDEEKRTVATDTEVTSVSETTVPVDDSPLIVCVDAGHGGDDPGSLAVYTDRYEKDDTLNLALAVEKHLKKSDVDMQIIMTRNDDTFISLDGRCEMANEANADLFVSLHRNSAQGANGVEVWVHSDEPAPDCRLAYNILVGLEEVGISKNKGVRFGFITDPTENYQVNRETNMPSCLVELGFMDSKKDNDLFDKNLDKYGKSIAEAIVQTAKELELKGLKPDKKIEPIETEYYNYEVSDYIPDPSVGEH